MLDAPDDDDAVYLAVGEVVDDRRPINQGDVYRGVALPGFPEGDHDIVILATHPCSLRAGAKLKPRLLAAPVRRAKHIAAEEWATSYQRQMPLPGLLDDKSYTAILTELGVVSPAQLELADRIAALSDDGIYLLQQRLVWALTHAVVGLDTLAEYSAPALAEIELLEEWNMALCAEGKNDLTSRLIKVANDFEDYVRASGVQADLAQARKRGDARRRTREELRRRVDSSSGNDEQKTA
jgi:hypothetical protein